MKNEKVIVFTTNSRPHPMQWLVHALESARDVLDKDVKKFVLTDDADGVNAALDKSGLSGEVTVCDVRGIIEDTGMYRVSALKFHGNYVTPLQVFRIALPVVPCLEEYDKVVFCDTDVTFEQHDWMSIFDIDVSNVDVAATMDCAANPRARMETCRECWTNPAIAYAAPWAEDRIRNLEYACAGVMVMNLTRLRKRDGGYLPFLKTMIDVCVEFKLPQLDQSLVNLYFDIKIITSSYNAWSASMTPGMPVWLRHHAGPKKFSSWFYPPGLPYKPQDKVDIVYVVGGVSQNNDLELMLSLRSIAKYGRNIGRVIVASPVERDWLADEVIQVKSNESEKCRFKHNNILAAILQTIDELDLHGEFLVSSDDHYYLKPIDFSRYPFNVKGWRIPEFKDSASVQTKAWRKSCSDTGMFLVEHGYPCVNFQMHSNAHWNAELVRDHRMLFEDADKMPYGCEPHVLMQNIWLKEQPSIPVRFMSDIKPRMFHGVDPSWECMSTYEATLSDEKFLEFVQSEFGEDCRYEK